MAESKICRKPFKNPTATEACCILGLNKSIGKKLDNFDPDDWITGHSTLEEHIKDAIDKMGEFPSNYEDNDYEIGIDGFLDHKKDTRRLRCSESGIINTSSYPDNTWSSQFLSLGFDLLPAIELGNRLGDSIDKLRDEYDDKYIPMKISCYPRFNNENVLYAPESTPLTSHNNARYYIERYIETQFKLCKSLSSNLWSRDAIKIPSGSICYPINEFPSKDKGYLGWDDNGDLIMGDGIQILKTKDEPDNEYDFNTLYYHGTDGYSAHFISRCGIRTHYGKKQRDFSSHGGFYLSKSFEDAAQYARHIHNICVKPLECVKESINSDNNEENNINDDGDLNNEDDFVSDLNYNFRSKINDDFDESENEDEKTEEMFYDVNQISLPQVLTFVAPKGWLNDINKDKYKSLDINDVYTFQELVALNNRDKGSILAQREASRMFYIEGPVSKIVQNDDNSITVLPTPDTYQLCIINEILGYKLRLIQRVSVL